MSFALRPSDGAARLLGPAPRKAGSSQSADSERIEKIQGAIQAVQQHAAFMRKDASILATVRDRPSSAQHVKQVIRVARETIAEAARLLHELDASSSKSLSDDKKLQLLTHRKLSENLGAASAELEQSWKVFAAAELAWESRQPSQASSSSIDPPTQGDDLEAGRVVGVQLQEAEVVSQAEVDLHAAIADEFAKDITELAHNMRGMQRVLLDLAEHTQAQGETLSGIEANMCQAVDKTDAATQQLAKTEQAQRKGMRWTICLLLIVLCVSGTVAATVLH